MTLDEYIRQLRIGDDYNSNLLVQITSHAVIADMEFEHYEWHEYVDPIEYTYPLLSGAGYDEGLLVGHQGVLKLAQKRHVEADGVIYNAGIVRCTGLGETFNDLKIGEATGTSGTLSYNADDSPLMLEVVDVDWLSDTIEVRNSINGADWADSEPVFEGLVLDGAIKDQNISFRISSLNKTLNTDIYPENWVGNAYPAMPPASVVFGVIYQLPVEVSIDLKVIDDFVYYVGTNAYDLYDSVFGAYIDGAGGTGYQSTGHANYGNSYATFTASSGWPTESGYPTLNTYVNVKGYDAGDGHVNTRKIGSIIKEITVIGKDRLYDDGVDTSVPILKDRAFDIGSLTAMEAKDSLISGISMLGDGLKHVPASQSAATSITVAGTRWDWRTFFNKFTESSLALWTINRNGSIGFHVLHTAPTETPITVVRHSDMERFDKTKVVDYTNVYTAEYIENDYIGDLDDYYAYPERHVIYEGEFLADSYNTSYYWDIAKWRILGRFGTHDYRFYNCKIAKALNIGDVVTFDDSIDDYLDGTKKGYVIGIDRGTKPYLDIRA